MLTLHYFPKMCKYADVEISDTDMEMAFFEYYI